MSAPYHVVTGAFGYTGRFIAARLLARGFRVATLVSHRHLTNPFGEQIDIRPLSFNDPSALSESLRGATVLYNTYWVRFNRGQTSFDQAIENTKTLLKAAKAAGVRRVVHISVTNPSAESHLPYFRGKAHLEQLVVQSGLSYAILRPALIFGAGDILINNIAWLLRHFPVFGIPGRGDYKIQPVSAEELAELAIRCGDSSDNCLIDAIGPETYSFAELVGTIAAATGSRAAIIHVPPAVALFCARLLGALTHDVMLTADELSGLMDNLLLTDSQPNASIRLSDWLTENAGTLGVHYASELARHFPQG